MHYSTCNPASTSFLFRMHARCRSRGVGPAFNMKSVSDRQTIGRAERGSRLTAHGGKEHKTDWKQTHLIRSGRQGWNGKRKGKKKHGLLVWAQNRERLWQKIYVAMRRTNRTDWSADSCERSREKKDWWVTAREEWKLWNMDSGDKKAGWERV